MGCDRDLRQASKIRGGIAMEGGKIVLLGHLIALAE